MVENYLVHKQNIENQKNPAEIVGFFGKIELLGKEQKRDIGNFVIWRYI